MTDWSEIVREHGPIVWRAAYRLLGREADVEDCFQNTFVSALELARGEAVRNWPGLLKRLATHRALERLRQRYRDSKRQTPFPQQAIIDPRAVDPGRAAESNEMFERLREAIAGLNPRQAQVFCLACFEGLSYREIAEQLGLRPDHVGTLLARARSRLQTQLQSHGYAPAARTANEEVEP